MLHTVLIVLHATAGVAGFAAGLACIPLQAPGSWRFRAYAGSLLAMLAFVAGAIGVAWGGLGLTSRLVFSGLSGLGLYMAWRAYRAWARLRRRAPGGRAGYLDDLGFTLIALFDGFVIVATIDLGLPAWLVALIALGGIAGGVRAMKQVKTRLGADWPADAARAPDSVPARSGSRTDSDVMSPPLPR
jgi:hypothetical protein